MRSLHAALVLAAATVLVGCADPLEGRWQGTDNTVCGRPTVFEVDSDLFGRGSSCGCDFSFGVVTQTSDLYIVDIDFAGVCFVGDGTYNCLLANDDFLDCDELGEYIRVD